MFKYRNFIKKIGIMPGMDDVHKALLIEHALTPRLPARGAVEVLQ